MGKALTTAEKVVRYAARHGMVVRKDLYEIDPTLSPEAATKVLRGLASEGTLEKHGDKRTTFYTAVE